MAYQIHHPPVCAVAVGFFLRSATWNRGNRLRSIPTLRSQRTYPLCRCRPRRQAVRRLTPRLGLGRDPGPAEAEVSEFARLLEAVADRFPAEVLIVLGGGRLVGAALALGRTRGLATVLKDDDPDRRDAIPPGHLRADVALLPSRSAADHVSKDSVVSRRGASRSSAAAAARPSIWPATTCPPPPCMTGSKSLMFIDADLGFEPVDVFRLLARPEPVVCGVYAKKGQRGRTSLFAEGVTDVLFGLGAPGLYPLRFAAPGFLRIKASVLRRMITELELPLCNTKWGRGIWPFFQPMIVPQEAVRMYYLGEDRAFSERLGRIGVTPMADTTIRLWHWGRHAFGWEDAGAEQPRYRSYHFRLPGV